MGTSCSCLSETACGLSCSDACFPSMFAGGVFGDFALLFRQKTIRSQGLCRSWHAPGWGAPHVQYDELTTVAALDNGSWKIDMTASEKSINSWNRWELRFAANRSCFSGLGGRFVTFPSKITRRSATRKIQNWPEKRGWRWPTSKGPLSWEG